MFIRFALPSLATDHSLMDMCRDEVASFFEPSLRDITAAVDNQLSSAQENINVCCNDIALVS